MSARLVALLCLALVAAAPLRTQGPEVVVYLTAPGTRDAAVDTELRREATALLHAAGFALEFRDRSARRGGDSASNLAFVDLVGSCEAASAPPAPEDRRPKLAATAVEDGVVLPFSRVDCAALSRVLAEPLGHEAPGRRAFLYGRALGRVVAHELYHVLAQTRDHAAEGIGRPCFTAADLMASQFEFEATSLVRMEETVTRGAGHSTGRSATPAMPDRNLPQ
jgi:hypothetical protein